MGMSSFEFNGNNPHFFLIKFQFVQTFPMEFIHFVCVLSMSIGSIPKKLLGTPKMCAVKIVKNRYAFFGSFNSLALFRTLHCGLFPHVT